MAKIGLIAAIAQERDALLRCSSGWKSTTLGDIQGMQNVIAGNTCILVTSGMGMKRAGAAARLLVENASVQVLISFGIAGAVENSLDIGDVVIVEEARQFENGTAGERVLLTRWPETACRAAEQVSGERGARLEFGTAITTDGTQVFEAQLRGISHPVLEMETMGIAQAATELGVRLLAVRAISDGPKAPIPFDLGEMMDENADIRISKLLLAVARRPRMVAGLGRMVRNTRIAADNAAIALLELLQFELAEEG